MLNRATLVVPVSKLKEIPRVGDPFVESMELLRNIEQVLSTRYTTSVSFHDGNFGFCFEVLKFCNGFLSYEHLWFVSDLHDLAILYCH